MKEFILKRVVKSKDLTSWVKSKKSMTYDFDNNKFTITSTLTADEMKFRASNASQFIFGSGESWKFNVGNSDPKTAWDQNASNFVVTAGSHTIELSFTLAGIATVTGI